MQSEIQEVLYPQIEQLEEELENKQKQLNFMMKLTQAINTNAKADVLFEMYSSYLVNDMGVGKLLMIFEENGRWIAKKVIRIHAREVPTIIRQVVGKYEDFTRIGELTNTKVKRFSYVIPVLHKDDPIAYVLIGDIRESIDAYDRLKFIITITNVVSVAIENKKLFNQKIEKERLQKEIELARQVQEMFIPAQRDAKDKLYEISSIYKPHSDVGGDYFDYGQLADGSLMLCLADVSGKGVPAAMLMANFQATLRTALQFYDQLDDLIQYINFSVVNTTKSEKIITFFILKYDEVKKEIKYVNAGHNPPVLLTANQTSRMDKGCTILGAVDYLGEIEVGKIELKEDALLLLFTDGLSDIVNDQGDYFSEVKLLEFSNGHRDLSASDFNIKLLEIVEEFRGKQKYPDDVAVLTCRIKVSE